MFGYVTTDNPNLYIKDLGLYKSLYCGLCKSIGATCGQIARLTLTYDLTFLSAILHNMLNVDVEIKKEHCIIHPFKKQGVTKRDALTDRIAKLNVILAYYKLLDDKIDQGKKGVSFLKKAYKKAKKGEETLDIIVKEQYEILRKYEKANCESVDISADAFGEMLKRIFREFLKELSTNDSDNFAYFLGKWIYLIDALDDFDDDVKKNQYNPFVLSYKDIKNKKQLFEDKKEDLIFVFKDISSSLIYYYDRLKMNFNKDLTDNIIKRGIDLKTKDIMEGKKCKKTIKF
ncbi:MAG: hypothetical protein E7342_02675 [Clostridiales bacterium]|nr:hypothetical protein [Clostridiales bacterium]